MIQKGRKAKVRADESPLHHHIAECLDGYEGGKNSNEQLLVHIFDNEAFG